MFSVRNQAGFTTEAKPSFEKSIEHRRTLLPRVMDNTLSRCKDQKVVNSNNPTKIRLEAMSLLVIVLLYWGLGPSKVQFEAPANDDDDDDVFVLLF